MKYPYKEDWWETKYHKKIKICDMETSHIENTIKFLKKHKDFYDDYVSDKIIYKIEELEGNNE